MTKADLIEIIQKSKYFDGNKSYSYLSKMTKAELKDIANMCEDYENGLDYM